MAQILTYPHGIKYQKSNWASQVKQGTGGSIPCNSVITKGTSVVTDSQSGQWWGDGNGHLTYSFNQSNTNPFNQTWGGFDQRGVHFWLESSKKQQWAKYFDIGSDGLKNTGATVSSSARSSWLREVTALWFLFHGHTTYEGQGCYAYIEKCGIRYRDPYGKVKIYECTYKVGELSLNAGVRGSDKKMFGYALPSSHRSTVCRNNYHFLGVRIQIMLKKTDGTKTRTMCGGCTGIRLGLGENPTGSYNTTNKRALVLRGDREWSRFEYDDPNFLETR